MLAKRVLRLEVERPILLRTERVVSSLRRRALGGTLVQQVFTRGITTPSLPNFSSSTLAEHVANLPNATESFDSIVHKSPHGDISIPNHTIWEMVSQQARANGDKTAFECGVTHKKVTFRELFTGARRLAREGREKSWWCTRSTALSPHGQLLNLNQLKDRSRMCTITFGVHHVVIRHATHNSHVVYSRVLVALYARRRLLLTSTRHTRASSTCVPSFSFRFASQRALDFGRIPTPGITVGLEAHAVHGWA
ncbi:hypothetical protein P3T76_000575 [Phytophthora citrophthora]|uniref:Uncharacterized protein n=1 Tax=Phytophthora citrophthora TaxID=4793 RepID=A0AAD9H1E2_9STRA|nr:hypothetical protein P3T76_000575 [Phytophthora citrophthora]